MSAPLRRSLICGLCIAALPAFAQSKEDRKMIRQLKTDIEYLASDELEGRRTGTEGERKAGDYLIGRYGRLKIKPYEGKFRHPFQFVYGKETGSSTIKINDDLLSTGAQSFPMPFSANKELSASVLPDVQEQGNIWLLPLYSSEEEANDAHFDWEKKAFDQARDAAKKGATGVVFFDSYGSRYPPEFGRHSDYETIGIPAAYVSHQVWTRQIRDNPSVYIALDIALKKTERTGHNIAAYIDNKAPYTVVLGAHYDHLGYGEDGSSLYAGKVRQIHNGADDNASGTAALLQLGAWLKDRKHSHYNYLLVHFSGEELGLFGSKAFAKQEGMDSLHIAYMLNMDMVGRLNDSTRALTLGGLGTSPLWSDLVPMGNRQFHINTDSSGIGPSDHSSFYNKGIPVLFFFTGSHHDYHKPTDDADKINYAGEADVIRFIETVIGKMDNAPKPPFTPTRQSATGKVRFKITLGIMPDYSYNDGGVRVDGVSEGKPADKAGIRAGDVITGLGSDKIDGMQSYMEALSRQHEGTATTVTVRRNGKELKLPVSFK